MKLKLANNIMIEIEALKECQSIIGAPNLAEEIIRSAKELAEIIKEEELEQREVA